MVVQLVQIVRKMTTSSEHFNKKIDGLDLIVFDLDYTLWPFYTDCTNPPFKKTKTNIVDARSNKVEPYPHSTNILQTLSSLGYKIGIASRTGSIEAACELVNLFEWKQYIDYQEIYPGCKVPHFNEFKKQSGIPFERMLFFDDEERNIVDINRIGAVSIHVKNGVSRESVSGGLEYFVRKQNNVK